MCCETKLEAAIFVAKHNNSKSVLDQKLSYGNLKVMIIG